jgi:hypothetical protein
MKKAALTIGLFSLAVVATSFTSPEIVSNNENKDLSIISPIDGVGTRDGRQKHDFTATENQSNMNFNQSNGLNSDRQSLRMNVKLD